jgi:hypothetical protein
MKHWLEEASSQNKVKMIQQILNILAKLPMTVSCLHSSEIGKTIKSLAKTHQANERKYLLDSIEWRIHKLEVNNLLSKHMSLLHLVRLFKAEIKTAKIIESKMKMKTTTTMIILLLLLQHYHHHPHISFRELDLCVLRLSMLILTPVMNKIHSYLNTHSNTNSFVFDIL